MSTLKYDQSGMPLSSPTILQRCAPWFSPRGQVELFGAQRGEILSTDATVSWWQRHDGCTASPTEHALPDRDPEDDTTVTVSAVEGCQSGSAVVRYRVEGGGHTWPGGKQYLPEAVIGRVSRDFEATRAIFDFFAEHER